MNIAALMTSDPVTIDPEHSAGAALRLMDEMEIRHLPVVENGELLGIVSDRELFGRTGWRLLGAYDEDASTVSVREVMPKDVVRVDPAAQLLSALLEMMVSGVGSLAVTDNGKLVGIVTEMDMLSLYMQRAREHEGGGHVDCTAGELATCSVAFLEPGATVEQASELCHSKGIHHVPIMDQGELLGILSDRDLRRAAGAGLKPDTRVEDLMSMDVITIHEDEPAAMAAELMLEYKISSVLVERGAITGILTITDVLEQGMTVLRGAE